MQLLARRSVVRSAARPASRPALAPRPLQGRQQQCSVLVRANPIKLSEKDLREQIDKPLKRAAQKRAMSMYNSVGLTPELKEQVAKETELMFDCVKAVANGKKPEQVLLAMKNAMPLTNENQTYLAMLAVLKSYTL